MKKDVCNRLSYCESISKIHDVSNLTGKNPSCSILKAVSQLLKHGRQTDVMHFQQVGEYHYLWHRNGKESHFSGGKLIGQVMKHITEKLASLLWPLHGSCF